MNRMMRTAAAAALMLAAAGGALAQAWPAKPVKVVIPIPAGGPADALMRAIAPELSAIWKHPVVIDNRPGASGMIGTDAVAKAAPDGYTVLYADSSIATNPLVFRKMPYDTYRDLMPVTGVVSWRAYLVVNSNLPVNSLPELLALAKAQPGKLNYASYGNGSSPHIAIEMLKQLAGVNIVHVPYKGAAPVLPDIMSGVVQVAWMSINSIRGAVKEGRVRPIAVDGAKRVADFPDLPTFNELGYPQMQANGIWLGMFVPAGTNAAIVDRIQKDVYTVISEPTFRAQKVTGRNYEMVGSTPAELTALMKETAEKFAPIVKSAGISAE